VVDIRTLEDIPIVSDRGGRVGTTSATPRTLKEIATIERAQGPVEAYHDRVHRVSQILVNVKGNDLARAANEIERVVAHPTLDRALANLPPDKRDLADNDEFKEKLQQYLERSRSTLKKQIVTQYGVDPDSLKVQRGIRVAVLGEVTTMRASFGEMIFNLVLAVLLVYLLMAAQFSSWLDPLIVIVAAPLGGIGVIGLLWLTGTSLNVQSSMGVLMMIGISVSNSVLLVDFANRQMGAGASAIEAIREAARVRLRPILMTTIATILGLLPLAVHLHPGDEMNLPLARAVVGGLSASTILTLFIVPVTYVIMKRKPVAAAMRQ
jgi:multidrug efflux pump subunit AcrB